MVVYLDVLWLLNVLADSLLLWITAIFLKRQVRAWRIIAGGLTGSLLILASITPFAGLAAHPLTKLCLSVFMVWLVFGYRRYSYFLSGLLTFYFATFLMGGILMGTHYFLTFHLELRTAVALESIRGFGDPVSWLFVALAFPIAWHFSRDRVIHLTKASVEYDVLVDVEIQINGCVFNLKGLIDSGNQLYDPISKIPVMVVSTHTLEDSLPCELAEVSNERIDPLEIAEQLPDAWREKMRIIPAKTLGNNHQLLCAFKPEIVLFRMNGVKKKVDKSLIVFSGQQLSSNRQFQCIIHPLMVEQAIIQPAS